MSLEIGDQIPSPFKDRPAGVDAEELRHQHGDVTRHVASHRGERSTSVKLSRTAPATVLTVILMLVVAQGASAAITTTDVQAPADPTFGIADLGALLDYTVTGTAAGAVAGEEVDLRCYLSPSDSFVMRAGIPVEPGGAFSATGIEPRRSSTCRLLAVPAGTEPTDLAGYTGPVLATGENEMSETSGVENSGIPYDFYLNVQQVTAAGDYNSIDGCGIDDGYLHHGEFEETVTWFCNDWYRGIEETSNSGFLVDGENAYFGYAAHEINQEAEGFPETEYSYSQDPLNGNTTIEDGESAVLCPTTVFPPAGGECEEFLPAGVRDDRTTEQSHDGHVVVIEDHFSSIDGEAHSVVALPDNDQDFGTHGEEIEYRFPGESGYALRADGDVVNFADSEPGVVYVKVAGAADGDVGTGRGAIVFFQESSPASFDTATRYLSRFEFENTLTVPATGTAMLKYAYVQGFEQAEVEALVAELLAKETPPAPPAPPVPPAPAPSGSSAAGTEVTPATSAKAPPAGFGIRKVTHVRAKGTARLQVKVSGPGTLTLSGRRIEAVTHDVSGDGTVGLTVTPDPALVRLARERGVVHIAVTVGFEGDGGGRTKLKKMALVLRP